MSQGLACRRCGKYISGGESWGFHEGCAHEEFATYLQEIHTLRAALAQLADYKRLLADEAAASLALTAELRDIAAAAGIFRHPGEKDQVANAVAGLGERVALLEKVVDAGIMLLADPWLAGSIKSAEGRTMLGGDEIPEYLSDCERLMERVEDYLAALHALKEGK